MLIYKLDTISVWASHSDDWWSCAWRDRYVSETILDTDDSDTSESFLCAAPDDCDRHCSNWRQPNRVDRRIDVDRCSNDVVTVQWRRREFYIFDNDRFAFADEVYLVSDCEHEHEECNPPVCRIPENKRHSNNERRDWDNELNVQWERTNDRTIIALFTEFLM